MTDAKIDTLFTLGEPRQNHGEWPDYLQYGFDQSDVPALLKLVTDQALHCSAGDSNEVWVPLHAWRALGQLRSTDAILPLIGLFDKLADDDWAISELSAVMGMIGEAALEPLAAYVSDKNHGEFARVMAMDGLYEIAKCYPELRDDVLAHYQNYLREPDTSTDSLNGLLTGRLLDLNAGELIDDIRALFNRHCVDISCAGDLEEIETQLGARSERSTPAPSAYDMHGIGPRPRPDDDNIVELIDYYLERYGNDESILGVSELDGYFTALACAPHTIMPSRWIPGIWGGELHSPEWESTTEYREFSELIMGFYNYVMESMNQGAHEAMFMIRETDDETYILVDEWCAGFLHGVNLWGPIPPADAVVMEKALQPIRLFATEQGFEQLETMNDDEVNQQKQTIEPAARKLFLHFLEQRKRQGKPVIRDMPKVGRNDLCPCGSGKKYKKCCLH